LDWHADLHWPVVLETLSLDWLSPPIVGVEPRRLDRLGGTVA